MARLCEKRYGMQFEGNHNLIFVVQDGQVIDICENDHEAMDYCWDESNRPGHEIHLYRNGSIPREIEY